MSSEYVFITYCDFLHLWMMLISLCAQSSLVQAFAIAFPDDPHAGSTPYTMWGVMIDPINPRDARVSVLLMKFLRARYDVYMTSCGIYSMINLGRNLNPAEAKDMFISTLRWRDSFDVGAAMKEVFPEDIFGKLGKVHGSDKEGHPVTYVLWGNLAVKRVHGYLPLAITSMGQTRTSMLSLVMSNAFCGNVSASRFGVPTHTNQMACCLRGKEHRTA